MTELELKEKIKTLVKVIKGEKKKVERKKFCENGSFCLEN